MRSGNLLGRVVCVLSSAWLVREPPPEGYWARACAEQHQAAIGTSGRKILSLESGRMLGHFWRHITNVS